MESGSNEYGYAEKKSSCKPVEVQTLLKARREARKLDPDWTEKRGRKLAEDRNESIHDERIGKLGSEAAQRDRHPLWNTTRSERRLRYIYF